MSTFEVGDRVAYEPRGKPKRTGRVTVVDRFWERVTVAWDDGKVRAGKKFSTVNASSVRRIKEEVKQ